MEQYEASGPVTCDTDFDTSNVKGKTAIVTGGANGMGEAYVRELVKAGAFVVFCDIDEKAGKQIESELNTKAQFLQCDVSQWKPQLEVFKQAIANSPNHRIDIVIANAGISGFDDVYHQKLELDEPEEPQLTILKINGIGVLYTSKLAIHYFRKQFQQDAEASKDQLLILQGSLAGYLDLRGSIQYAFCKWGMRAMMRNLRRTEHVHGMRTNYIAPWFVETQILSPASVENLKKAGFEFAEIESATRAVMKQCSDPSINGHTFAVVPYSMAKTGYVDTDKDDYDEEPGLLKDLQDLALGAKHRQMGKADQATKAHAG